MTERSLAQRMEDLEAFVAHWLANISAELVEAKILTAGAVEAVLRRSAVMVQEAPTGRATRDAHRLMEMYLSSRLDLPSARSRPAGTGAPPDQS